MPQKKPNAKHPPLAEKTSYGKVRYEIDPYNRLIVRSTGKETKLPRFRQVLTGRFKTDKNNSLTYLIKAPTPKKEREFPIRLSSMATGF